MFLYKYVFGTFSDFSQQASSTTNAEMFKTAYFGISATTGQLADNHDVLSMIARYVHPSLYVSTVCILHMD